MLLPERHSMKDFFVLDVVDVVMRSDMASMEHPLFSLHTKPDRRTLRYDNGAATLRIIPGDVGLPTIFDKDILIYCISHLMHRKNRGEEISRHVRLTTHDLLVNTNRRTNNLAYQDLLPALQRLRRTSFETSITTGAESSVREFSLIDEFEYNRKGSMHADRLRYMEIVLSDWLFRSITAAEVLPIHRDYFRLRSAIDRRVYEIARKHCGTEQRTWRIGMDKLQLKTGARSAPKHFAAHMRRVVAENHLPDYGVQFESDSDNVVFYPKKMAKAPKAAKAPAVAGIDADTLAVLIPEAVMAAARQEARARNRDFHALKVEFVDFMNAKGEPDTIAGAFLGFVRQKDKL